MARICTETINEETPARFTRGALEVSRSHEVVQVVSHFICHDLRAVVRHILGFVQFLHGKANAHFDSTNQDYLDTILESGKTMATLMDDLLNLAHVERFETPKKELDLNNTVEEALNQLYLQIAGRPAIRQGERLPIVLGDLSKLLLALRSEERRVGKE